MVRKTRSDKGKKRKKYSPNRKHSTEHAVKAHKRKGRPVKEFKRGGPLALGSLSGKNESLFGTDAKDPWKVKRRKEETR